MTNPLLAWSENGPSHGPPLLMGSSLGTTREMWAPGLGELGEFRVIRFDHLGHGESAVPKGPYSMEQLGNAVLQLMDHLGIERASYAGLSLGGAVGQWLAIHRAQRIDRLALLATAAYFPDRAGWQERAAQARTSGTESVADTAMTRWFTDEYRGAHADEITSWRAMVSGIDSEGYAGCCEALAGFDTRADLDKITAPTLVIAGDADPSTPPATMQVLAHGIAGARLEIVTDAAHLVHVPHPRQVGRLLAEHLRAGS